MITKRGTTRFVFLLWMWTTEQCLQKPNNYIEIEFHYENILTWSSQPYFPVRGNLCFRKIYRTSKPCAVGYQGYRFLLAMNQTKDSLYIHRLFEPNLVSPTSLSKFCMLFGADFRMLSVRNDVEKNEVFWCMTFTNGFGTCLSVSWNYTERYLSLQIAPSIEVRRKIRVC